MSPDSAVDYIRKIKTVSNPVNTLLFKQEISVAPTGLKHEKSSYEVMRDLTILRDVEETSIKF